MLISFTLENYRSFKDKHMVICQPNENITKYPNNIYTKDDGEYLKIISIFGHNAAGKSNIIKAIECLKILIMMKNDEIKDRLVELYDPFMYDETMHGKPTFFEVEILSNNQIIRYNISFNNKKIISEYLSILNNEGKEIIILDYKGKKFYYQPQDSQYSKNLVAKLLKDTQLNNANQDVQNILKSIINEGVVKSQVSIASFKLRELIVLKEPAAVLLEKFFSNQLIIINNNFVTMLEIFLVSKHNLIGKIFHKGKELDNNLNILKNNMMKFIKHADLYIQDIYSDEIMIDNDSSMYRFFSQHKLSKKDGSISTINVAFDKVESEGTRRLFGLSEYIFKTIENGGTLIIDEIDIKLHPLVLLYLIKFFNNLEENKNGGQLIFTTHASELLDIAELREDQILFVAKDKNECSSIYPLFIYDTKDISSVSRSYLFGRFGAIPRLPSGYNFGE